LGDTHDAARTYVEHTGVDGTSHVVEDDGEWDRHGVQTQVQCDDVAQTTVGAGHEDQGEVVGAPLSTHHRVQRRGADGLSGHHGHTHLPCVVVYHLLERIHVDVGERRHRRLGDQRRDRRGRTRRTTEGLVYCTHATYRNSKDKTRQDKTMETDQTKSKTIHTGEDEDETETEREREGE
jgi:hypothetical protein